MTLFVQIFQLAAIIAAVLWTWFKVRPFMNTTASAATRSLEISEKVAATLDDVRLEAKRVLGGVEAGRVEKLLAALERMAEPRKGAAAAGVALEPPEAAPPLGPPPPFNG